MLPRENIFDLAHYRSELSIISDAMKALGEPSYGEIVQLTQQELLQTIKAALFCGMAIPVAELAVTAIVRRISRRRKNRYRGKYLAK